MRKATRKEEIDILEEALDLALIDAEFQVTYILPSLEHKYKVICTRCAKYMEHKNHISYWEWMEFLSILRLGWKRYFYTCAHKDSIFVRIQLHQLKSTGGCVCCLYWRAIGTGFLIASIISFLISLGKYLS